MKLDYQKVAALLQQMEKCLDEVRALNSGLDVDIKLDKAA
jgi:hypothetical protein